MADIKEIDYDRIVSRANEIARAADEMQKSVQSAFGVIQTMSNHWFGQSYDNFVSTVNMSISGLNKLFETTVSDIPHEIAAKAKSYAASNQAATSVSLNEQVAIILSEVAKTNKGAKLRFRTSEVEADQNNIKTKFENAKSAADKASSIAQTLTADWQSISGDTNIAELKSAFMRVKLILDNLASALDGQIKAQATTIEALETAASAIEATQDVVENAVDAAKDLASSAVSKIQQSAADVWTNLTGKN